VNEDINLKLIAGDEVLGLINICAVFFDVGTTRDNSRLIGWYRKCRLWGAAWAHAPQIIEKHR